jgi:hypothetical protein
MRRERRVALRGGIDSYTHVHLPSAKRPRTMAIPSRIAADARDVDRWMIQCTRLNAYVLGSAGQSAVASSEKQHPVGSVDMIA